METSTEAPTSSVGGRHVIVPEAGETENTSIRDMGYYDIMILGLTGQGKTTTADKLLIANPERIDYESRYPEPADKGPKVDPSKRQVAMQGLHMWLIPDNQDVIKEVSIRIKNLASNRVLREPHQLVNAEHESENHSNKRTLKCELLSNETTKIRVLDVPGFFSAVSNTDQQSQDIALSANEAHLGIMRNILQIQAAMAMRFKRILYFLPCRDSLQISSAALQQELQLMCYYFGRSIFEAMVLVATLGPTIYRVVPKICPVQMPDEELEKSRAVFHDALKSFIPIDTPNPPIIFISLRETCESILQNVQGVNVDDGLQLQLRSTVCARCSVAVGERKGMRVACASDGKWSESILYEDSHCHPFFVPRYTTRQKITNAVTNFILHKEWPDFSEEKCHKCSGRPGSRGCMLVGSKYNVDEETYTIDHTSLVEEYGSNHLWLFQEKVPSASLSGDVDTSEGDREDYRDLLSHNSEGFEQRDVIVDIGPGQNPEAGLVIGTRSGGTEEGGASNFPEIEVLHSRDSEKKGT